LDFREGVRCRVRILYSSVALSLETFLSLRATGHTGAY
jgi:hypothetical protein